jgi:multiple sugar transport system ATP-binding protein
MRVELKKLHQRLGTTAIYVTHDQVEAMTLGDRVVVMKDGLVQQVGEPLELYNKPANKFVAGFIGSPAMNFVNVTARDDDGAIRVTNQGLDIKVPPAYSERLRPYAGRELTLAIRPEDLRLSNGAVGDLGFDAVVEVVEQLGSETLLDVKAGPFPVVAAIEPTSRAKVRDQVRLTMNPERLHFFDSKTEVAL